ncbi:MAG: leucine-rich repeat domain-containing protein [Kiritimatiellae bacterium]|nr:leucine-rich repeat domain-containing protein [Kiritimatiellia bacterium]
MAIIASCRRAAMAMVWLLIAASAMAATETINGIMWTYSVEGGTAIITGAKMSNGAEVSGAISIPSTLGGVIVEKVGDSWYGSVFYGCAGVSSVTFPDSVTEIGVSVFYGCTGLRTVTFGTGLRVIGGYAFNRCANLRTATLPSGLVTIGDNAFSNCSSLKTIDIPDSVVSVGRGAFAGCKGAARLELSESLATIKEETFAECYGIKSVVIPDSVASIGSQAFAGCAALATVTVGEGVMSIGNKAFGRCNSATGWDPDFDVGCTNLQSIVFYCYYDPYMGDHVFGYNDGWNNSLPANCIAYVVSSACGWDVDIPGMWNEIQIRWLEDNPIQPEEPDDPEPDDNELQSSVNGRTWRFTVSGGIATIKGVSPTAGELVVPGSLVSGGVEYAVSRIGANAFANAKDLAEITIPDSVESISTSAFGGCDRLWASWFKRISKGNATSPVSLTVTNIVVHYVTQSVPSSTVVPPTSAGIVNVISEVNAGAALAITADWAEQYPGFAAKFGNDFSKAVTAPTGKTDGSGRPMMVWQDFVAGTDPTDPDDVFRASITFDEATGAPIVSWTPELSASEAAKRTYKTFGKVRLNDADWTRVDGDAANYNFFKVTVEMK